jgi:exo-1,4-beta-D-glucosaminidase
MTISKNALVFCGLMALLLILAAPACAPKPAQSLKYDIPLADGWLIQSSAVVKEGGAVISTPGMDLAGWYPASVPTTVLAALLKNGEYPDPFVGKNLESIPRERFAGSWWYRKEFELPADKRLVTRRLGFDGINYRANIWPRRSRSLARSGLSKSTSPRPSSRARTY